MNAIFDIREITESREMMEAQPHKFMSLFIYLLLFMIGISFLWCILSEIDISVKAHAVIRPNSKISTITNAVSEKVEEVNFEQGKKVFAGDILYSVKNDRLVKEQSMIKHQLDKAEYDLKLLEALESFILYGTEVSNTKEALMLNPRKQLENEIIQTKDTIDKLVTFKNSIEQHKNLFSPSEQEYYTKFLDYKYSYELLKTDFEAKEDRYLKSKQLFKEEAISLDSLNYTKEEYNVSKLELDKYKNQNLTTIHTTIEDCEKKLKEVLADIEKELISYQDNVESLRHQLVGVDTNIEKSVVKAPIEGIVNVITELNRGDYVLEGTEVLTIIPDSDNEFKCKIYVSNKDITKINVGDKIKYKFKSLPYKEYGTIKGEVLKISSDIASRDNTGGQYLIEATVEDKDLYNYKGEMAYIKPGMEGEAIIITDRKTILRFLLEKLDLS